MAPRGQVLADLGGALRAYARRAWPTDTAKLAARRWGVDPETGRNVAKGHVSARTLTRAIQADGYDVLDALGQSLTGLSRAEWEHRKLQQMQEELHRATMEYDRMVARADALAAVVSDRAVQRRDGDGPGRSTLGAGGSGRDRDDRGGVVKAHYVLACTVRQDGRYMVTYKDGGAVKSALSADPMRSGAAFTVTPAIGGGWAVVPVAGK